MVRRHRPRAKRSVRLAVAALLAAIAAIIVLIVYARQSQSSDRVKIMAVLAEAERQVAAIRTALEESRKNLPPGSSSAPAFLTYKIENRMLEKVAQGFIDNDGTIPQSALDELGMAMEPFRPGNRLTPFLMSIDPAANTPEQVNAKFSEYLLTDKTLEEIEKGVENGLYAELSMPTPQHAQRMETYPTVVFLGARAIAEAKAGDLEKAVNTCVCLYRLGDLIGSNRLCQGIMMKAQINADTDKVVCRMADMAALSVEDQERLTAEIGKRLSWTPLMESFRFTAAFMESGQLWGRPYRDPLDAFFRGRYGRGAMQLAEAMIRLLETPSADTPRRMAELPDTVGRRRRDHPFIWFAFDAYNLHARDITRAKAMYLGFILKAWKRGHGSYPASLDELEPKPNPDMLNDALGITPLDYETTPEGGFTISVIGQAIQYGSGYGKGMPFLARSAGKRQILWESRN